LANLLEDLPMSDCHHAQFENESEGSQPGNNRASVLRSLFPFLLLSGPGDTF